MAKHKRRTKRLYYGPDAAPLSKWWTVTVSNARQDVTINGSVLHAIKSHKGVTIGCTLSNTATDAANKAAIPHAVYLAVVTKTKAYLVDKLWPNGDPKHAVVYAHSYGHITDRNDDGTIKQMVLENPAIMERAFTLRVPPAPNKAHGKSGAHDAKKRNPIHAILPRGALLRARKAGFISKAVAQQLTGSLT